jgi:hypothetical protein
MAGQIWRRSMGFAGKIRRQARLIGHNDRE